MKGDNLKNVRESNKMLMEILEITKMNSKMNIKESKNFIKQITRGLYTSYKKEVTEEMKIWAGN